MLQHKVLLLSPVRMHVVLSELATGIATEGMSGSAGDIAPISMTGKYDNATASSIKGFKKILAGVMQCSVPFVCCKDSFLSHPAL